jgi:hypothetical protein
MSKLTPEEALMVWSQFRQLAISPERLAELAPFLRERLAAIDELWTVDVDGVEPALNFWVERRADVP